MERLQGQPLVAPGLLLDERPRWVSWGTMSLAAAFSEAVGAQLKDDLGALGEFPRQSFADLVELVLRLVINPTDGVKSAAVATELKQFAAATKITNMAILQAGARGLVARPPRVQPPRGRARATARRPQAVLQLAARRGSSGREVREASGALGLDGARAEALGRLWEGAVAPPGAGPGVGDDDELLPDAETLRRLVDLEWKFGVTAASSESGAGTVGRTFLQLELVLDAPGGGLERVYLELTLNQFYEFLAHMERAKAALASIVAR